MHRGPIILPEPIQVQCRALINLGNMLQLFSIATFIYAMDIHHRIISNSASILDLQKVVYLCDVIMEHSSIDDHLRGDIASFRSIINTFITASATPTWTCGVWNGIITAFDDDQWL